MGYGAGEGWVGICTCWVHMRLHYKLHILLHRGFQAQDVFNIKLTYGSNEILLYSNMTHQTL